MKQPDVWHHGLVARDWAEFGTDGGQEATYFRRLIEMSGQPALDLGCGTGRLLLPYLQAGLDVDGCDYSQDMLALCAAQAKLAGLSPQLYAQAMHELDLPRRYRTIFACGVVGLGGNKLEALSGDRKGQYSIRINDQYRICFVWTESGPDQVEIVDYH
jgi:plasmid maintenance system killer protein